MAWLYRGLVLGRIGGLVAEVVWLMLIEVWACSFCQTMDGTKAQCHSISKGVSVVKRVGRSRRHVGLESTSIPPLALE